MRVSFLLRLRVARWILMLAAAALAGGAAFRPADRLTLGAIAVAVALTWALAEMFALGLERLVGFRYLHRGKRSRWASIGLVAGLALVAVGFVVFALAHPQHRHRIIETAFPFDAVPPN